MIVKLNHAQKQKLIDLGYVSKSESLFVDWELETDEDKFSWRNDLIIWRSREENDKRWSTWHLNFHAIDGISLDELLKVKA